VWGLQRASAEDIASARAYMLAHGRDRPGIDENAVEEEGWVGPTWTEAELETYVKENDACVVVIEKYALDVTRYIEMHVGFSLLFPHQIWNLFTQL
jgi:hypothetical protein